MIVKFLYTSGPNGHFPAVAYNSSKLERNKGELMKVMNFEALQAMLTTKPEDFKNYLKMVSATNKAVKKPQFHVAISAPGKSYNKYQLEDIATQWLERMGYGKQPYLLVFHKDTANNHVHVISTRVDKNGKKIRDSYEQIRGQQQMNIVMGIDEKRDAGNEIADALTYRFTTEAQFRMILESKGYVLRQSGHQYEVIKFGKVQGYADRNAVTGLLKTTWADDQRKMQLQALFHKYAAVYETALEADRKSYHSDLSSFLKNKFGIELVFHASGNKPPYGYTVIDHTQKNIFKGSEIMQLRELLTKHGSDHPPEKLQVIRGRLTSAQMQYYAAILKSAIHNYPELIQGLRHHGIMLIKNGDNMILHDPSAQLFINTAKLLSEEDQGLVSAHFIYSEKTPASEPVSAVHLAADIDDEAIHGRNRRRKKKARTNSR